MTNEELQAALRDFPPECEVFAESDLDFIFCDYIALNEDGEIILTERPA